MVAENAAMCAPTASTVQVRIVLWLVLCMLLPPAAAQEQHQHPPQDMALHNQFYSTWMRPDAPEQSCCNNMDCAPAASKLVNGRWYAKRDLDQQWMQVPEAKIEKRRDSPDGRSHLCAPWNQHVNVYCFVLGSGM